MSAEATRWLVEQDPAILLNSDLSARADSEKRLIGQALLIRFHDNEAPAGHISYVGLAYAGLADDLRPLIPGTEPFWRRREAMRIIAETGLRELDSELVSLIEATAAAKNPDDYDDEVQLAVWAIDGLRACSETALLDRLRATAADDQAPDLLRAEIMSILWPGHMSTSSLYPQAPGIKKVFEFPLIGRCGRHRYEATRSGGADHPVRRGVEWPSRQPDRRA
jgi:hypothetical protein